MPDLVWSSDGGVGCVAFTIGRGIVVVDPQVPPDEAALWTESRRVRPVTSTPPAASGRQ